MMIPDGLQQKKIDGRPLYIRRQGKDGERGKGKGDEDTTQQPHTFVSMLDLMRWVDEF